MSKIPARRLHIDLMVAEDDDQENSFNAFGKCLASI